MLIFRLALSAALAMSCVAAAHAADAPARPVAAQPPAAKPVPAKPVAAAKPAAAKPVAPAKPEILTAAMLLERARAAMAKGEVDAALMLGQSAIVAESTNPMAYVALGDLYVRANQAEFARGFYDQALNLDPQDQAALAAIAQLEKMPQAQQAANGG